jgi:hypothetical protein
MTTFSITVELPTINQYEVQTRRCLDAAPSQYETALLKNSRDRGVKFNVNRFFNAIST